MSDKAPIYDYGDDGQEIIPKSGDNTMSALAGMAKQQIDAEAEVERLQDELKKAQQRLRQVQEFDLPELMAELGLESFATDTGFRIDIKESIHASPPKARYDEAMDWFDATGNSAIVKREFKINFTKDEEKWANKFQADLRKRKRKLNTVISRKVEPSTLRAFVRERLEAGEEVPTDLLGVHRRRVSKVQSKA